MLRAPWLRFYGEIPSTLEYPDCSMTKLVMDAAAKYPHNTAYDFFGSRVSYAEFAIRIKRCAAALHALGIAQEDRVTICMPNTPEAVIMFYALNRIGAVCNMVHPLSSETELIHFINTSRSRAVFTLDQFYPMHREIFGKTCAEFLILSGIDDGLTGLTKLAYKLTKGRKITRTPTGGSVIRFADLNTLAKASDYEYEGKGDDVAAILYSGGTSGTVKGILLTNLNFNALAMQTAAAGNCVVPGRKMLAIMPIFHGFGLGVCIHTMYISGVSGILMPQFSISEYAKLLKKHRPHYIAGVPTLYEALLRIKDVRGIDLSQLMGVFSGGDTLTPELKRKVDKFLKDHGANVQIREGYGLTECVTASCLTPRDFAREGSIGIPYPDTFYKIVKQDSTEPVPYNKLGEICLTGPTVMKGYCDNDEETAIALKQHNDGAVWLHTGDLGFMDEDGFVYYRSRIKRMIISSGYSIYPSQIENVIDSHEAVLISCVIGVPDDYKGHRLKAFIVLRPGYSGTEEIRCSITEHCKRSVAKYAMPREFEFRPDLPRTLVGKVAYAVLEKEESEKREATHRDSN